MAMVDHINLGPLRPAIVAAAVAATLTVAMSCDVPRADAPYVAARPEAFEGRAAIYLYQDHRGIWAYDQWRGRPVHKRLIRFEGGRGSGQGSKSNDGKLFAVIV